MAHGVTQYFLATCASGGSITSDINLTRGFARVFIDPAGATNSIHFQVAPSVLGAPGTYRLLKYEVASGMSAPQTVTVGTAVSGSYVEVGGLGAHPFIKIVNVGGAADGATFKIVASDL